MGSLLYPAPGVPYSFPTTAHVVGILALLVLGCDGGGVHAAYVPAEAEVEAAIAASDDFTTHKAVFLKATASLVGQGTCSLSELKEMGLGEVPSPQESADLFHLLRREAC